MCVVPKSMPAGYGNRQDGSKKQRGWLGEVRRPDGSVMTEYSVGVNIDGKETEIPTLVPGLTKQEIEAMSRLGRDDDIPDSVMRKAIDHARTRTRAGKSPFWTPEDR